MSPWLSIIIVTHDSANTIGACLQSILPQLRADIELLVIDNASGDQTANIVQKQFPQARLIRNDTNRGYGTALNQGISLAQAATILAANSDIRLDPDFLVQLQKNIQNLPPDIGMIAPKIIDEKGFIDSTGLDLTMLRRFFDRGRGLDARKTFLFPAGAWGACGACAIYQKSMLEAIRCGQEYFDEDFFLGVEDFDLAWRAQLLNYRAVYLPNLEATHRGGISRTKNDHFRALTFRNRYFLLLKNESAAGWFRFMLYAFFYDVPRLIFLWLTNPNTPEALRDLRRLTPRMLEKRRMIRQKIS
ncbi:MAG: glycosyltransferase family 2 protein [Candidatus Omnitrophota bacterium]